MQNCSSKEEETIARLFYNASTSFTLLFFFFYFTSILLSNLFFFFFFPTRNQDEYEFSEEEEEEEEENEQNNYNANNKHHLVADILDEGETLVFLETESNSDHQEIDDEPGKKQLLSEEGYDSDQRMSFYSSPALNNNFVHSISDGEDEDEILGRDSADLEDSSGFIQTIENNGFMAGNLHLHQQDQKIFDQENRGIRRREEKMEETNNNNNNHEEDYLVFEPSMNESKKLQPQGKEEKEQEQEQEDIFGDSCTVGSTSKSSSEWRSSNINYRDYSGTDDPFSSSSRRSCPKWESYTVFQKYDEEMMFLDRITAQKLHETESLRSIQSCPRSISDRIVYKLAPREKHYSGFGHGNNTNPYHELEVAYVAQICWTWEALNCNYKYFQRLRATRTREQDPGCPAHVVQQFQQFLVLLQRYVENEPYEYGRRPEIFARMRTFAPKLLQVPEYRDSVEEEKKEESFRSRISSDSFVVMMEEIIKTFMDFLKADKQNKCQMIILTLFRLRNRNSRRGSVDPTLLFLLKKVNKKKKMKLKELYRRSTGSRYCCIKKRKMRMEEEMEIVMAMIDLKVVSRVLRMNGELNDEQLHWCEDKMSKIKVSSDGKKLLRDSSPLFFPAPR